MAASKKFSVAVHALACLEYLNRLGEDFVSSELLAASVNTNAVVIRGLLVELRKAKLVISKEGKGGGSRLAKPASKLHLDEVYRAVEHYPVIQKNSKPEHKQCPVSRGMKKAIAPVLEDVDLAVIESLSKKTLKQVVDQL